ncbi:MAG TPA: S8 family serine peptidase, partial [Verrucomicrobiae bacterium]
MRSLPIVKVVFTSVGVLFSCQLASYSQLLDQIGVTALRAVTTHLDGTGIRVAMPEGELTNNPPTFEVNPANVGQPVSLFTYISSAGSATTYPNSLGTNSWHAEDVADYFFGPASGVATNVAHVDNYDANYFVQGYTVAGNYVVNLPAANINDPVVNQSFGFVNVPANGQQSFDTAYDNYAAQYHTLFVSAANNGGPVSPPGTSYNCVSVGAYDGASSYGPTLDNGRAKPDITAPAGETSFSTPQVSGAAALLMQASLRGDGGGDTNSAFDIRTIKALLLNGAVKPTDWTNISPSPLDTRYGAGVLNVLNSYEQLAGGKHGYVISTTVSTGGAHPPTGATGSIAVLSGWDF